MPAKRAREEDTAEEDWEHVIISSLELESERVTITNNGANDVPLKGWTLESLEGHQVRVCPACVKKFASCRAWAWWKRHQTSPHCGLHSCGGCCLQTYKFKTKEVLRGGETLTIWSGTSGRANARAGGARSFGDGGLVQGAHQRSEHNFLCARGPLKRCQRREFLHCPRP